MQMMQKKKNIRSCIKVGEETNAEDGKRLPVLDAGAGLHHL